MKNYYISRIAELTTHYEAERAELMERAQQAEKIAANFDDYANVYGELGIAAGEHEAALAEVKALNSTVERQRKELDDVPNVFEQWQQAKNNTSAELLNEVAAELDVKPEDVLSAVKKMGDRSQKALEIFDRIARALGLNGVVYDEAHLPGKVSNLSARLDASIQAKNKLDMIVKDQEDKIHDLKDEVKTLTKSKQELSVAVKERKKQFVEISSLLAEKNILIEQQAARIKELKSVIGNHYAHKPGPNTASAVSDVTEYSDEELDRQGQEDSWKQGTAAGDLLSSKFI